MTKYEKIKIGLLGLFIIGFLFCFYNYSENQRYIFSNKTEFLPLIMDSKTGEVYFIQNQQKLSLDKYKPYIKNE
jgi:hypothetical protein